MISLTRLNQTKVVVNADTIVLVEATPDTLLTLANGVRLHVRETVPEVLELAVAFQRLVRSGVPLVGDGTVAERLASPVGG
jgi:flagellar protein FlbD